MWSVEPAKVTHPILNGMTPWIYDEEFFTKERLSDDPHPIMLTGSSANGVTSDLAWAFERKEGGRGFVMTGADIHKNMLVEQHRRICSTGLYGPPT